MIDISAGVLLQIHADKGDELLWMSTMPAHCTAEKDDTHRILATAEGLNDRKVKNLGTGPKSRYRPFS